MRSKGLTPTRRLALAASVIAVVGLVLAGPALASNDPGFAQLWNIQKVRAPEAWNTTTGAGVRVGIVDTGVDVSHPDLAGRIAAAVHCTDDSGDPSHCVNGGQDIEGHGTHVSGIIAADKDNGIGVVGVAPSASLYMVDAFHNDPNDSSCQPCANINDIAAGIRWLTTVAHVQVINLSLGDSSNGLLDTGLFRGQSDLREPVEEAWQNGAIPVIAAGNNGGALFGSSADYGTLDAVVVGASGPNDEEAFYSSDLGNAKWGIVAPGGDAPNGCTSQPALCVLSTWPGGKYAELQGTSMSTPHVTGALALLLSRGLTREQAVSTVLSTANKPAASWCGCSGRLDVAAAVAATSNPATTSAPPPPNRTTAPTSVGRSTSPTSGRTSPTSPAGTVAPATPATAAPSTITAGAGNPTSTLASKQSGQVAATVLHDNGNAGGGRAALEVLAVVALLSVAAVQTRLFTRARARAGSR